MKNYLGFVRWLSQILGVKDQKQSDSFLVKCLFLFNIKEISKKKISFTYTRQVGIQLQEDKNKKETYVKQRECEQNSHKMVIIIKKCLFYVMIH